MRFHCDLIELRARSRPEDRRRSPAKARGSYYRMEHRGETNDRLIASFSIPNPVLRDNAHTDSVYRRIAERRYSFP